MITCAEEREPLGDEALKREQEKAQKYAYQPERRAADWPAVYQPEYITIPVLQREIDKDDLYFYVLVVFAAIEGFSCIWHYFMR